MAEEFTIKSEQIEAKINQLLPSQGGFGAGVDFSASTMVIPIVDLTETAEGSALRQDLQTALSHSTANVFDVSNATTVITSTTGYYRVTGTVFMPYFGNASIQRCRINISDGTTDQDVYDIQPVGFGTVSLLQITPLDFNILIKAGGNFNCIATQYARFSGNIRQIADLSGNLVNP